MGMADIAEVLWSDFLSHNPQNPNWCNRDRFILSNGHGSMLHYALLHLSGYDLKLDDLKAFRQLDSKTPGHPEIGDTPGIETTTGPLGQGLANAVGMALAEQILAAHFNRPSYPIVDHYTYAFVGDGCLMEGISHEASSLAGTLGLGKLIVFYDDNNISIDGEVDAWFTTDTVARFRAYGWHVADTIDGHDANAIEQAIIDARNTSDKPSLIPCRTTIGYGAPQLAGSAKTHGAPLGAEEVERTRKHLNWPHAPFVIPNDIYAAWDATQKGSATEQVWQTQFQAYVEAYPDLAAEWQRRLHGDLPHDWQTICEQHLTSLQASEKTDGDHAKHHKLASIHTHLICQNY